MAVTAEQGPGRSDARRNRARVLGAAQDVFARLGTDAAMPDIAAAAGVGVATVHRHFKTKDQLLELVLEARLEDVRAAVRPYDRPLELEALLLVIVDAQNRDRSLAQLIGADLGAMPHAGRSRDALFAEMVAALEAGQGTGALKEDLTPQDLTVLLCGVGHAARTATQHGADWRHTAGLMLIGLRSRDGH